MPRLGIRHLSHSSHSSHHSEKCLFIFIRQPGRLIYQAYIWFGDSPSLCDRYPNPEPIPVARPFQGFAGPCFAGLRVWRDRLEYFPSFTQRDRFSFQRSFRTRRFTQ